MAIPYPSYTYWPAKHSGFIDAPLPRFTCKKKKGVITGGTDGKFGRTLSNFGRNMRPFGRSLDPCIVWSTVSNAALRSSSVSIEVLPESVLRRMSLKL